MAKRAASFIATLSIIGLSLNSMTMADSVEAPAKRSRLPVEHVASQPATERKLDAGAIEDNALAEHTDAEEVSGWSEIWE